MSNTALAKVNAATAYTAGTTTGYMQSIGLSSNVATSSVVEPSGGSPAYARVAPAWGTPNAVTGVTVSGNGAINVPAGFTVASVWGFTASSGGSAFDGANVTSQNFASQGTYTPTLTVTPP